MQITETSNEGLKRQLKVVVGAAELSQLFERRVDEVKGRVSLKGFRPGKVPASYLKKVYGRSLMAEVVQQAVSEHSQKALDERKERPAFRPEVKLAEDATEIENVLAGKGDLAFSMAFEVIPPIAVTELSVITLEREVATPGDAQIDEKVANLAERGTTFETKDDHVAVDGDRIIANYVGKIDGVEFEGGKGEEAPIVLGSGSFIPGFEDGLTGVKAGEERTITVTFPEPYPAAHLAGKTATFDVTVKEVGVPVRPAVDDEFSKRIGFDDLSKLREAIAERLSNEYATIARSKLKRGLLDALDGRHSFELPPTLVENEFKEIWKQVTQSLEQAGKTFADEGKTEEGERAEYRKISERRVRLGLILSEIGESAKVSVTDDELARGLAAQARRFPGQEQHVYKFYRENPAALAQLRAPIFEEKVVDHILARVQLTDKPVTVEDLYKGLEEDDGLIGAGQVHDHDHGEHDHHDHRDHDHDHHDHHGPDHKHHDHDH